MFKQKTVGYLLLAVFLFSFLRLSQNAVLLTLKKEITINGLFKLAIYKNYGIAFGLNLSSKLILVVTFIIIIFLINWYFRASKPGQGQKIIPLSLIISGAMSNFIERLNYGYVLDYLEIGFLPVFNLADLFICLGVIWIILIYLKEGRQGNIYKN